MRANILLLVPLFTCVASREVARVRPRQLGGIPGLPGGGGNDGGPVTNPPPPDTSTTTTTTSNTSTTTSDTTTTTTSTSDTTTTTSTSSTPTSRTSQTLPTSSTGGITTTATQTSVIQFTPTNTETAPTNTNTGKPSDDSDAGVSTGTIIGLSVAGGIAVIGIVAFIIWKVTRKRFSDLETNGEEIKWPELTNETHALPARPTGRAGIDDDGLDDPAAERSLYGGASSVAGNSMADLNYNDPYAVPPLPHMNPNQPYRDDPSSQGAYYDPYRGPVPQSLHDPPGADGSENIPLNTYSPSPSGRYTPQPYGQYDGSVSPDPAGRRSPGPAVAYSGRQSPGPNYAYGQ